MSKYADLEIGLHGKGGTSYIVEFRYRPPDSAAESRLGDGLATIKLDGFQKLLFDVDSYGEALTDCLFADDKVRAAYLQARTSADSLESQLRFRLYIHPDASGLHGLRWETLRDPQDSSSLSMSENLLFSRYVCTPNCRPVRLRSANQVLAPASSIKSCMCQGWKIRSSQLAATVVCSL